jgi:hypothetical protein
VTRGDLLDLAVAKDRLGLPSFQVLNWLIKAGHLTTKRVDGSPYITLQSVVALETTGLPRMPEFPDYSAVKIDTGEGR